MVFAALLFFHLSSTARGKWSKRKTRKVLFAVTPLHNSHSHHHRLYNKLFFSILRLLFTRFKTTLLWLSFFLFFPFSMCTSCSSKSLVVGDKKQITRERNELTIVKLRGMGLIAVNLCIFYLWDVWHRQKERIRVSWKVFEKSRVGNVSKMSRRFIFNIASIPLEIFNSLWAMTGALWLNKNATLYLLK